MAISACSLKPSQVCARRKTDYQGTTRRHDPQTRSQTPAFRCVTTCKSIMRVMSTHSPVIQAANSVGSDYKPRSNLSRKPTGSETKAEALDCPTWRRSKSAVASITIESSFKRRQSQNIAKRQTFSTNCQFTTPTSMRTPTSTSRPLSKTQVTKSPSSSPQALMFSLQDGHFFMNEEIRDSRS